MLVHDDVLATGGTARAICDLAAQLGGEIVGVAFMIELDFLDGPEAARRIRRGLPDPLLGDLVLASEAPITTGSCTTALTTRYTFACPERGEARVALSSFRRLERLPGPAQPAVFEVEFGCACGDEHPGLLPHDELDWAPLGLAGDATFLNLMTASVDPVDAELADLAARRIQAGEWPWSFFCYPEERPRPVFPSAFLVLAGRGEEVALAVRCPVCGSVSINLVCAAAPRRAVPQRREMGVVEHVFAADAERAVEEFVAELYSSSFDGRRLALQ